MRFRAWSVTCGGDRYCTAVTRLRSDDPAASHASRLRVSRYQSGEREIVFVPARDRPAADAPLNVRVDRSPTLTLAPGEGYRAVGGGSGNTYLLAGGETTAALIGAMRTGRRIELSYRSAQGKAVVAGFVLDGFAPALAVVDAQLARFPQAQVPPPQAQAVQTPQAQAVPAPQAQAAPAPQAQASPAPPAQASPAPPDPAPRAEASAAPVPDPIAEPGAAPRPAVSTGAPAAKPDAKPAPVRSTTASAPPPGRKRVRAVREFACRGNEPGWNFIIDNDKARFELAAGGLTPEAIEIRGKLKVTGEGRTPDIDWRGKAADGRGYRAFIQQQQCTDSMSDAEGQTAFQYRVQLTLPGSRVLQGCCNAGLEPAGAKPAAAPAPDGPSDPAQAPLAVLDTRSTLDWSRMLMELMPAIDACLARTPGAAPYVTKAWMTALDTVVIRTRNSTVGWFECVARRDGGTIESFQAVESNSPIVAGEEVVLYTPVASPPPAGNCFTHERVADASGDQIGWLSTNTCVTRGRAGAR